MIKPYNGANSGHGGVTKRIKRLVVGVFAMPILFAAFVVLMLAVGAVAAAKTLCWEDQ